MAINPVEVIEFQEETTAKAAVIQLSSQSPAANKQLKIDIIGSCHSSLCLYLPTFPSQRCEIFNRRIPGFPKTTRTYPKTSEDIRRRSEHFSIGTGNNLVHLSEPSLRKSFTKHDLVPNAFLVRNLGNHRNRRF